MKNLLSNKKVWLIRLGLLVLPLAASAAATEVNLEQKVTNITGILNAIVTLLLVLVTIYFFWGVIQYITASGSEDKIKAGKLHMIWGIIGMTVMVSVWGIASWLLSFFGVTGEAIPTEPGPF